MIVREIIEIDGKKYVKHSSDQGFYIKKIETGEKFVDAVDIYIEKQELNDIYVYEETDEKWEVEIPGEIEQ